MSAVMTRNLGSAEETTARIGPEIAREIRELKVQWMAVGAAFQSEHPACAECGYIATFEGAPGERLCECSLGSRPYHKPTDCPALQQATEEA